MRAREWRVPGLAAPAEIVVDKWGIPHIRARSRRDAYFVQGFNAARDRLWQLDIWRKRGLGLLAADYGPGFLAQDRAARLFLYRGDMAAEWAAYSTEEARLSCEAFVAGLNAFVTLTESGAAKLPAEFAATNTRPARWAAEEIVRIRSHALVRNVLSEVARARIAARAGLAADIPRAAIEPDWTPRLPEGLDPSDIPADVLDVFRLATAPVDFPPARVAAPLEDAWRWSKVTDLGEVYVSPEEQGSNNWVIAAARSATGRPVMANDPHRAHSLPSLRYIVHLSAPDMDVIGAGEPAIPGISIGHNGHAAFGITIFPMDQEDLYVYETDPADPDRYRYADGWETMRVVEETIPVRGAPDQRVSLKFTRHGPVVHEDPARRRAYAIRSVWFEAGGLAYFGAIRSMHARSIAEFRAALHAWAVPSLNHVYADASGDIGWFARGKVPYRRNWDGLTPVPGDGRYEWDGFVAPEDLPSVINPARGYFATANEMNIPAGYPYADRRLGFEWSERSRSTRIHAVLDARTRHTIEDSLHLQCDAYSVPAARVLALLDLTAVDATARALFAAWDMRLTRASAAAALFEVWWTLHLKPALLDRLAADAVVRALLAPGNNDSLCAILENPGPIGGAASRAALLGETLAAAVARCRDLMGEDATRWAWGRLHHGYFPHPLARLHAHLPDVGPLPKGGSGSSPMNAGYRNSDFRVISGASFRIVVDVGAWDNSRVINAPGQSGDPASPHYADLAPLWADEAYVPLLYTRDAVDAAAAERITLQPG